MKANEEIKDNVSGESPEMHRHISEYLETFSLYFLTLVNYHRLAACNE